MPDIYFLRQFFVLFTGLMYSLCVGFMLGFPTVLNQALISNTTSDLHTTPGHASWIVAINGVGGLLGCFTLPAILQLFGRKAFHISVNCTLLVGWIMIPLASDIALLYAGRFIQGISNGGIYINSIIISEYVHPCRRGYFITMKKISISLGTLFCHALGTFCTWRQIAIIAALPSFLAIVLTFFWPESPSYLALKGRYSECEKAFIWMNGNSTESERHLRLLVETQKEKNQRNKERRNYFSSLIKRFLMKDFQKSVLIVSMLTLTLDLCGRYYFIAYVIQIMRNLLGDNSAALYFTLGADVLIIIALSSSGLVITFFKRRTLLMSFGAFATLLMLLISLLVYLKSVYTFSTAALWLTALLIIFQCLIVNVGLIPVSFAIIGEIFPLEHKSLGSCVSGLVFTSLYGLSLKITPVLMEHTQLYGTYAIYGASLGLCLILLYRIVPETKDKPLQEIEDDLNGVVSLTETNRLLSSKCNSDKAVIVGSKPLF